MTDENSTQSDELEVNAAPLKVELAQRLRQQREAARWVTSHWSVRLWLAILYLQFFWMWFLATFIFLQVRTFEWHQFWTAPTLGGCSPLGVVTAIHVSWAVVCLMECIFCGLDNAAPYRWTRIGLYGAMFVLFASYAILVRAIARSFITIGPM